MPRIITPGLAYKHLRRYRQVVGILTKYGLGEFFGQIRNWGHTFLEKGVLHREHELADLTTAQRMRLAMEELGPTFIKMGQMLSTRPDVLPHNYIIELEKLQDQVTPIPAEAVRQVIESELGRPVEEIFSSFDDQPLAAASLAQVHRATLRGKEVVVKVQRPHIADIIEVDLDIMYNLAGLLERYLPGAAALNPRGVIREFGDNLKKELDFRLEAGNMQRFARNFARTPWVRVPEIHQAYCTQRILTMEYIRGINASEVERLKREGYDLALLARRGADIGFRSALEFGYFHADPHPGNIFILPGNVICLLDYGMMGILSNRDRERLGKLLYFVESSDEKRAARILLEFMESSEIIDAEALENDVCRIILEYAHVSLREVQLGPLLFKLLRLLREHHARFPTRLIWLFKAIAAMEDVSRRVDPDFVMLEAARPYARRLLLKGVNPFRQAREAYFSAMDSAALLQDLPYDIGVVIDQLKKGQVKIEFEHVGLEPIRRTLSHISHHIALTMLLSSLVIASALLVLARIPPLVGEISVIGIIGFGLAALLVIALIIAIILER